MSLVNRYPAGLLGLFDAKSNGKTPPDFSEQVRGTVDLGPNYRATVGVTAAIEVENVAAGVWAQAVAEIPIPAGETWHVYGVSSRVAHGAAENAWFNPALVDLIQSKTAGDASGSPVTISLTNPEWGLAYTASAGTTQDVAFVFPVPIILQAPVQIGTFLHKTTFAAPRNVTTQVWYARLD